MATVCGAVFGLEKTWRKLQLGLMRAPSVVYRRTRRLLHRVQRQNRAERENDNGKAGNQKYAHCLSSPTSVSTLLRALWAGGWRDQVST